MQDGPHIEVRIDGVIDEVVALSDGTVDALRRYFPLLEDDASDEQCVEALEGADPDDLRSLSRTVARLLDWSSDEEIVVRISTLDEEVVS